MTKYNSYQSTTTKFTLEKPDDLKALESPAGIWCKSEISFFPFKKLNYFWHNSKVIKPQSYQRELTFLLSCKCPCKLISLCHHAVVTTFCSKCLISIHCNMHQSKFYGTSHLSYRRLWKNFHRNLEKKPLSPETRTCRYCSH